MFIPIVLSLEEPAGYGASELLLYCLSTFSLSLSVSLTLSLPISFSCCIEEDCGGCIREYLFVKSPSFDHP